MKKVSIIDYGMGNLLSITRAFEKVGAQVIHVQTPEQLSVADFLVLPGVGAFPDGMRELEQRHFVEPIREWTKKGKPFLGVCLGMQMMLSASEEITTTAGLNLVEGQVLRFPEKQKDGSQNKIPHVAWNSIAAVDEKRWKHSILQELEEDSYMYFVHSYFAQPAHEQNMLSLSPFGDINFCSAIIKDNLSGTQFHPEKSADKGLQILSSFIQQ